MTRGRAIAEPDRSSALELLRREERFLLCGHERPDGDCLGSQSALARVLISLGKTVHLRNPDPPDASLEGLVRGLDSEAHGRRPLPPHDAVVLLDFHELARAGELGRELARSPARKLVIDHHPPLCEAWWDAAYLDPTAAATGLLVRRIARELGVPLDREAARAVFTALVTDTGWFKHSNTDAETLRVAAELVDAGVEPASVHQDLFQQRPLDHPLRIGRLLAGTRYHAGGRLAVIALSVEDDPEAETAEVDDAFDLLRSVAEVEVVLLLRETSAGRCRLSARSKRDFDVNALARRFGGGGHRRASGATLDGPLAAAASRAVSAALEGLATPAEGGGGRP